VSEEIIGRALNDMAIREEIVLATKVNGQMGDGPNRKGLSRKHIFDACDASLKRLNMDYIDLYQIHHFNKETSIGNKKLTSYSFNHVYCRRNDGSFK
jgi:1-deoxyxylulose-5-phosphate synthase